MKNDIKIKALNEAAQTIYKSLTTDEKIELLVDQINHNLKYQRSEEALTQCSGYTDHLYDVTDSGLEISDLITNGSNEALEEVLTEALDADIDEADIFEVLFNYAQVEVSGSLKPLPHNTVSYIGLGETTEEIDYYTDTTECNTKYLNNIDEAVRGLIVEEAQASPDSELTTTIIKRAEDLISGDFSTITINNDDLMLVLTIRYEELIDVKKDIIELIKNKESSNVI